jgi:penicillin-binding protein 1A
LSNWIFKRGHGRRQIDWLALDARFESGLFGFWQALKDGWADLTAFNQRFTLTGVLKLINELFSEALCLGSLGFALLLGLAQPAFDVVAKGDFLAYSNYAVTFVDEDGNELGKRGIRRSDAVPLEEMPDYFIKSLLATEDRRFFEHYGIDIIGTMRALTEDLKQSQVRQGGSSLTQQLAKNLFLSSERSLQRKIKEAFLAIWLEAHLSKHDILKLYLERAYMGGGAYGAEAAAQFYFGKSIRNVTLAEAAMLAGLFKAPTKYAPHANLAAARKRADDVLSNLVDAGFMTEAQVHDARVHPATPVQTQGQESPDWFLDWAFEEVQRVMQGKSDSVLVAEVTVDSTMQRIAEETVQNAIRDQGKIWGAKQSALVTMEPDGAVKAIVGGVDYGDNAFNRATQAKRQPGSSFKPYVYLTAVEQLGYTPETTVSDGPYVCRNGHAVRNDSGPMGRPTLGVALSRSINTVAVRMIDAVTRKKVNETLVKLHVTPQIESCTMALGDGGLTLLEHVGGYTTFINGGKAVYPYAIVEIRNTKGDVIYSHDRDAPKPEQVFQVKHIAIMNQMLRRVLTEGTAAGSDLDFTTGIGKTGTTSSHRDAWFIGGTGKYVTGIWIGNDDNHVMHGIFGGQSAAPMWKTYMTAIHTSPDIPQLAGLPINPSQLAAMQQLAAAKAADPTLGRRTTTAERGLSEHSREILRRIAELMKRASSGTGSLAQPPDHKASREPNPAAGASEAADLGVQGPVAARSAEVAQ